MPDTFDRAGASRQSSFLWVDLTRKSGTVWGQMLHDASALRRVTEPGQVAAAIQVYAPHFLCFEFDQPDGPGIAALTHTRQTHPRLPVLMLTDSLSEAMALWALRIRLWDLLVKPVAAGTLRQHIAALSELTRQERPMHAAAREILFPPYADEPLPALQGRTQPAISYVAAHFVGKIALDQAAALCRLSPSRFCRVFRQENGMSFAQYLLRYRIERACERLCRRGALAKEVAYSVGFNDLSYFTRAFKRQVGVCPSQYQADVGSS
jgi:two-component system, response regulator YesN